MTAGAGPRVEKTSSRDELIGSGDPSPIDVDGTEPAVLAIHGFGGTPLEVALVVDIAKELGLRAHAPLLPGHGTRASELARTGWREWSGAAERAFDALSGSGQPIVAVGLSLGSLLAAHLAATRPDRVLALGMLASATRLSPLTAAWPLRIIDRLGLPDFSIPKAGADIADPAARATHLTYRLQPVHAAIEVMRAGARVEALLPSIRCPAFVAHGLRDHVCPVENADRVLRSLGSTDRTKLILPRSFHIVTRDYDRELLRSALSEFVAKRKDAVRAGLVA